MAGLACSLLLNDLATLPHRTVLGLEDYHVISSQQIQQSFQGLLNHLPLTLRLVLISRHDPSLPLALLVQRGWE
ncbi:hypothetical protein EPA93_14255 [Ktedonosporobacter rubrisoli]|uniref:Uncharacterized protein n=1 Tax=Ktedonosporobacter rubrisoli TaxID=2509675 RepID=A0A4P6JPN0_KTERU|nr:hypothetical protein [Ktedonosporobacter rubrisoli]QBD77100.1 hypothetical protein EPA93_14255 [Ktedonosporobacter rubrisoli]